MNQEELRQSLKRLYARSRRARIASLVSGPWGIGKTYCVNKVLSDGSDASGPTQWYYLSIFGKSSTDDLLESLWLEVVKRNVKQLGDRRIGAVSKYLRSALDAFKGQFAGAAAAISTLQRSMLDDLIREDKILVIDDLERKSPALPLVDLLGFVEMYREKCSVIVIGNVDGFSEEDRPVFDRYSERLFDQQYVLTDVSEDVLGLVLGKDSSGEITQMQRQSVISSFKRDGDSNMRTLLKTRIVLGEVSQQLAELESSYLLDNRDFIPSVVALMIEKHSKGRDISKLALDSSWLVPDDATSAFIKEYALPTRIGFTLAPFVELLEHKRLKVRKLKEALGVLDLDRLASAYHTVVYHWCHSADLVREAWEQVMDALGGESVSRFSLREIVDFAYATGIIRRVMLDLSVPTTFESWIVSRLKAASKALLHDDLREQYESVNLGYQAVQVKPLVDEMAATIQAEAVLKRSSDLKAQFEAQYSEGEYYHAFRLVEDKDFPTAEVIEVFDRISENAIPNDYFFALRTLLQDLRIDSTKELLLGRLSARLVEAKDPLIRARIEGLIAFQQKDKT